MCACTWRRSSVIIFCADFESSCVKVKEVRPCTMVAARMPTTIGVNRCSCFFPTTLSTKDLVDNGRPRPATRLTAMSRKPSASKPRRGLISAQTSGRFFQAFLRLSLFDVAAGSFSVVMISVSSISDLGCRDFSADYTATCLAKGLVWTSAGNHVRKKCIVKRRMEECSLIRPHAATRRVRRSRSLEIEHAGDKFTQGEAQMAPEAAFQTGVVLCAAEKVAHQLPEHRAAPQELHHARRHGGAQERSAVKAAHDASGELQFRREGRLDPRRIFFRAALRERLSQQFARAHGVKQAFARQRIYPRRRVANQRPVLAQHGAFGKGPLLRRRKHVTIELCALGRNLLAIDERV